MWRFGAAEGEKRSDMGQAEGILTRRVGPFASIFLPTALPVVVQSAVPEEEAPVHSRPDCGQRDRFHRSDADFL